MIRQRRGELQPLSYLPQCKSGFACPEVINLKNYLEGIAVELSRDRVFGLALAVQPLSPLSPMMLLQNLGEPFFDETFRQAQGNRHHEKR